MADSEEVKSVKAEYESDDADGLSALRWTARRMEASDDDEDGSEELKDKYRWSCAGLLPRDESDGGEGASECYDDLDGRVFFGEELEEVSQEEEEELQETVRRVNKAKEKQKAVSDEVSVPRSGWFYMHDDRFLSRRYRTRRGTITGMKLWDCKGEPKWKHDKFEDNQDMTDKSAPKGNCQQQRKNRTKGHRYADTNQFGSLDNDGNQNSKTSGFVKGRGPVKYKPIVKSNNLNPTSKHQIAAKIKESTSSYSSSLVSSCASSHDIFMTSRNNEQYGRSNKCTTYQPYSTLENQDNNNRIPLPPLYSVIGQTPITANSLVETLPQTTNLGYEFVGRGSGALHGAVRGCFQLGGSPSLSPVIRHGRLHYGAVDDHSRTMALVGYAPQSQLGSRNCGKTSILAGEPNLVTSIST